MDSYLSILKDLEKNLEKHIDKLELGDNEVVNNEFITELNKNLEKFKINLDEAKNLANTKHEEIYVKQYFNSYSKLKNRFSAIRNTIESNKLTKELIGNGYSIDTTKIDILLNEGKSLDHSLNLSKDVIDTAEEVKSSLAYQKEKVLSTSDKIVRFVETVPGISKLIGRISRRKRFNAIVIGLSIFICTTLILIYLS